MALPDNKKATIIMILTVLFLGFSYILSSAWVASTAIELGGFNTESLKSSSKEVMSIPKVIAQETLDARYGREGIHVEGRMDFECNDYPGTGANNHHDPRPPERD